MATSKKKTRRKAAKTTKAPAQKSKKKRPPRPAAAKARSTKQAAGRSTKAAAKKARRKSAQPAPELPPADEELPEFAVVFIDSAGQQHVATALAPDPAAALTGLLEQAALFDEPWLDDLVAVMVAHPATWASVEERVLAVFR